MNITLLAYRCYGEEKLKKPTCLKGLKPAWEMPIIKKKCQVYELASGSLVLYMGELFCKQMSFPDAEDMTMPFSALARKYPDNLSRKSVKGFIYADAWCNIYERNEGYIYISGLREAMSDVFRLKVGPLYTALYNGIRTLSLCDYRFLKLGMYGCEGADSADYSRLCENIVNHYFILARDLRRNQNTLKGK